jgi:2-Cys peroxiredoxin 5
MTLQHEGLGRLAGSRRTVRSESIRHCTHHSQIIIVLTIDKIRFVADPTAEFTKALDVGFDEAAALFGGTRSKRYALKIKDGKVAAAFVEPDNTGTAGEFSPHFLLSSTPRASHFGI